MQTTDFDEYLLSHTSETNSILNELFRETNLKILMPRMLAEPLQGKFT